MFSLISAGVLPTDAQKISAACLLVSHHLTNLSIDGHRTYHQTNIDQYLATSAKLHHLNAALKLDFKKFQPARIHQNNFVAHRTKLPTLYALDLISGPAHAFSSHAFNAHNTPFSANCSQSVPSCSITLFVLSHTTGVDSF